METYLHIGGLVAAGFDQSAAYLLTISHSGRGIFSTRTWERVARDTSLAYPEGGIGIGIGPIEGRHIQVSVLDFNADQRRLVSTDGRIELNCQSDGIFLVASDS